MKDLVGMFLLVSPGETTHAVGQHFERYQYADDVPDVRELVRQMLLSATGTVALSGTIMGRWSGVAGTLSPPFSGRISTRKTPPGQPT